MLRVLLAKFMEIFGCWATDRKLYAFLGRQYMQMDMKKKNETEYSMKIVFMIMCEVKCSKCKLNCV